MTLAQRASILQLTDHNRGGSQRSIVDLARADSAAFRHYVLRAGSDAVDLTDVDDARVLALDGSRLPAGWPAIIESLRHELGLGCIHAHALEPLLALAETKAVLDGLPFLLTLHDLRAVNPRLFVEASRQVRGDAAWIARCAPVLDRAARVIVPSAWLRDVLRDAYPGVDPLVIPNGIDTRALPAPEPALFQSPLPASARTYAVVGAIGEHKGRRMLEQVASGIADPDIVGVVIGYTDVRSEPGWIVPGRLYLHGPYRPAEVPALLAAYACRLAYFPNIVPESFSYVLSEVWQAGLPALVPDVGALGSRMRAVGGGWLLADPESPVVASRRIGELLAPGGAGELSAARQRLAAAPAAVPSLSDMRAAMDDVYRAQSIPRNACDPDAAWLRLGARFHAARVPGIDDSLLDAQWPALAREEQSLRAWNDKLRADIAALDTSTRRLHAHFEECVMRNRALDADIRDLKSRNERIEADAAALSERTARSDADFATVAARNQTLEHEIAEIGRRNIELEQHVIALRERNARVEADVIALVSRNLQLEGDVVAVTARNIELHTDVVALKERNTLVEARFAAIGQHAAALRRELELWRHPLKSALRRLTRSLRKWLPHDA